MKANKEETRQEKHGIAVCAASGFVRYSERKSRGAPRLATWRPALAKSFMRSFSAYFDLMTPSRIASSSFGTSSFIILLMSRVNIFAISPVFFR